MFDTEKLKKARECLVKSRWGIDDILRNPRDETKAKKHTQMTLMSLETAIGNMYEFDKQLVLPNNGDCFQSLEIALSITAEKWLNIRVNSLLPNNRIINSAKLFSSQVKTAIVKFTQTRELPRYNKAFLGIIEHCSAQTCGSFDHDNKNLQVIPNCLKGIVFPDDDQFHLSLGIFAAYEEEETYCDIYVLPLENADEFIGKYVKTYA